MDRTERDQHLQSHMTERSQRLQSHRTERNQHLQSPGLKETSASRATGLRETCTARTTGLRETRTTESNSVDIIALATSPALHWTLRLCHRMCIKTHIVYQACIRQMRTFVCYM